MTGSVGEPSPVKGPDSMPHIGEEKGPASGGGAAASGGPTLDSLKQTFIQAAKDGGSTDPDKDGKDLYNHFINQMCVDMINQMNETKPKKQEDDTNT